MCLKEIAHLLALYGTQVTANSGNPAGDNYGYYEASGSTNTSTNGGVGSCLRTGRNCGGGTQDTDFYRSYQAGTLKNLAPVFVVGVLHSASPADFTPSPAYPVAAVNNADYTGISIADNSPAPSNPTSAISQNVGVVDGANPNSTSQYAVAPNNRVLLGSGYAVLNYLMNPAGQTLYSKLSSSAQKDINNISYFSTRRPQQSLSLRIANLL